VSNITVYIYYLGSSSDPPQLLSRIDRASVSSLDVRVNASRLGLYLIWINASSAQQTGEILGRAEGFAVYTIRTLSREEFTLIESIYRNISTLSIEISNMNSSLLSLISSVTSLRDMYLDLVNKYSTLYRNLESLSRELNNTKKSIESLQDASRLAIDEANRIRGMFYLVVGLTMGLAIAMIYTIYRARRSSYSLSKQ